MDIFGILDPDPHENLCGSETLDTASALYWFLSLFYYVIITQIHNSKKTAPKGNVRMRNMQIVDKNKTYNTLSTSRFGLAKTRCCS